jgi:hypothetical protein
MRRRTVGTDRPRSELLKREERSRAGRDRLPAASLGGFGALLWAFAAAGYALDAYTVGIIKGNGHERPSSGLQTGKALSMFLKPQEQRGSDC